MRKILMIAAVLLINIAAFAQQKKITGTVLNKSTKTPLEGVSVQAKSKTVITDAAGKFSIEAAQGDLITFTYVGLKTVINKVTNSTQDMSVEMEEGVKEGEQVIVVGYSSQRKRDLTGAVAVVDL